MSIELLPPAEKHPDKWHVRSNQCNCHPETCCCNPWAVCAPDGKKQATYFNKGDAEEFARFKEQTT